MEVPFKYLVLYIIKILNNRKMPLIVEKSQLITFVDKFIEEAYPDIKEKIEIESGFDFEYELDSFLSCYCVYFDFNDKSIVFDKDYIDELDSLLEDASGEYDKASILITFVTIDENAKFLDILNINLNKDTYNYLLDIDRKLEEYYMTLADLENYVGLNEININDLNNRIKKIMFKRMLLIMNTKNILSSEEYNDFVSYANGINLNNANLEDFKLLLEDEYYNENVILSDLFKKSIFVSDELCYTSLYEKLKFNLNIGDKDIKYSKLKFYLTFLELLEEEIKKEDEFVTELVNIKYRLMFTIDSLYDSNVFTNRNILEGIEFRENYTFDKYEVYYFINELLMYDDDKYKNKEFNTDNIMVYVDSIIKKLLIKTYYNLTGDKKIIDIIMKNKLYDVNEISSGFLKDIYQKSKIKIKEV